MQEQWRIVRRVVLAGVTVLVALSAADTKATCKNCSATYISNDEVQQYFKRVATTPVADQQVRAVDIGKGHVAIGVISRGKTSGGVSPVAEHSQVSEVYHIIDGSGTLVTGPDITEMKPRPADSDSVKLLNGPGNDGKSIRNGITYQLKAGDVVVIPAGTGHWFTNIDDHIRYLMVRIDPDAVTPLKDAAASQADLLKGNGNTK